MAKFILWAPRVLTIIITIFLSVMVFNIFKGLVVTRENSLAALMNISPALIMIAGLVIGWKHKLAGGIIIMILGIIMTFLLRKYGDLIVFLPLATPILVTGILYVLSFLYERQILRSKNA
jgi:hypothetical protein